MGNQSLYSLSQYPKLLPVQYLTHYIEKIHNYSVYTHVGGWLTLNAPIATKVVCFSHLLKCERRLYGKQCGPRSDCSYRSSLFWVHTVCFYTCFVSNARQLFFAADDFSRQHFQMHFFLGALRVNKLIYGDHPGRVTCFMELKLSLSDN